MSYQLQRKEKNVISLKSVVTKSPLVETEPPPPPPPPKSPDKNNEN